MGTAWQRKIFFWLCDEIFDANRNFRSCGRELCISLIRVCNEILPEKDYGNVDSGFVNRENVFELYNKLKMVS